VKTAETGTGILDLLAEHERAMGNLYRAYSEVFPQQQGFWLGLAAEEMMHAGKLIDLAEHLGPEGIDEHRFRPQAVAASLECLASRLRETQVRDLELVTALSVALDLEKAMIEQKWFEVLKSDSPQISQILANLAADTRRHMMMVRAMWDSARSPRR
jgi:rubrerythrin